jgi:hypothetical protein
MDLNLLRSAIGSEVDVYGCGLHALSIEGGVACLGFDLGFDFGFDLAAIPAPG